MLLTSATQASNIRQQTTSSVFCRTYATHCVAAGAQQLQLDKCTLPGIRLGNAMLLLAVYINMHITNKHIHKYTRTDDITHNAHTYKSIACIVRPEAKVESWM